VERVQGLGPVRWLWWFAQRVVPTVAVVAVWELVTRAATSPFFPPPSRILRTAGTLWFSGPATHLLLSDTVFGDIVPSLERMLGGFLLASVVGVALGALVGLSAVAMDYLGPLLHFLRAIPPPMLLPFFLVALGLGTPMQLATIIFGTVWPILLNTVDGVRGVDPVMVDTARAFRFTRARRILGVVLPAALPKVFAGLRLGLSLALILMIISEISGSTNGIGYQLLNDQRQFDLPQMWAYVILLGVVGYGLNSVLLVVQRRTLAWQQPRG
jgi:ABC-type nitrate/sulfonate/bicarbonate transport system permease component